MLRRMYQGYANDQRRTKQYLEATVVEFAHCERRTLTSLLIGQLYLTSSVLSLRYSQGGSAKRNTIINDVDEWIVLALNKYDNDVIIAELRSVSHCYTHELLELCKGTIKAGKMTLAKTYFSVFPSSTPEENTDTESAS